MTETQKTVLIVEDSPVQATFIGQMLLENGVRVLYAPDGRAGVYIARRYLPDAIILDLEMPRMNGFEACRRLKDDPQTAHIPTLMLTQYTDKARSMIAGSPGGTLDFIAKDGFGHAVLLETLRELQILA
jgi:twitching motility two-component system response regulator PilH